MKKTLVLLIFLNLVFSCNEEIKVDFKDVNFESSKEAEISINFPKAEGNRAVSDIINTTIQNYIINQTNLSDDSLNTISIEEAIKQFNTEFVSFKNKFPESSQQWEAFIDGEVTYQSPEVICIAVNTYIDTGGAHGNTTIKFLNFNPQTGKLYSRNQLIGNIDKLLEIIENELIENIKLSNSMEDYFFGEEVQLPESLGYSDEGLIILYNPYEIASYAQGIVEFTIPFEDINEYLKVN